MTRRAARIEFEIDEPTPLLNKWQRWHWGQRKKYSERLSKLIRSVVRPPREPIEECVIVIERHSSGLPDWDGLYGGMKPLLDCMVRKTDKNPHGLGIIEDDNPHVVKMLQCVPKKAKQKQGKTNVRIYTGEQAEQFLAAIREAGL